MVPLVAPSPAKFLDCTLRDGSYQLGFQFSSSQTERIARSLSFFGIDLIEVGHGSGIGASMKIALARETDLNYAKAAENGASGRWGMFAIPGIAEPDEVLEVADEGMSFVRIGLDPDTLDHGLDFISRIGSARPGLAIFVNFMKSYTFSPEEFSLLLPKVVDSGVKGLYLVDSAGGMGPDQIKSYGERFANFSNQVELGFHAHNNLGLAVANCFALRELGFTVFDCSLQGLGRSSGNAPTEQLVALFVKTELCKVTLEQLIGLCKLGEDEIRELIPEKGVPGLDTMAGYADFHSSFMDDLVKFSEAEVLDPYEVMVAVTNQSKTTCDARILDTASVAVRNQGVFQA